MIKIAKNLKLKKFSIRENNKVMGYGLSFVLLNAHFEIKQSGQKTARQKHQRNVHAFICGDSIQDMDELPEGVKEISYNPFTHDTFYYKDSGLPVLDHYEKVYFQGQRVYV